MCAHTVDTGRQNQTEDLFASPQGHWFEDGRLWYAAVPSGQKEEDIHEGLLGYEYVTSGHFADRCERVLDDTCHIIEIIIIM